MISVLGCMATVLCLFLLFMPSILDILAPLNVSRPREILFPGEYFVDQQKYFHAIVLHLEITIGIAIITMIGTESLYVTYVQHACGMFQVAR
jgi:hypothetical protein